MQKWPLLGPVAVVLIEARVLVETPSFTKAEQRAPTGAMVDEVHDEILDILFGVGVSFLGLAAMVVFVCALATWLRDEGTAPVAGVVMVAGSAVTAAAVGVGFGVLVTLGAASEESSPATLAAVYIISDSLGYIGWTGFGLVTGAVFVAGRTSPRFPAWIAWFSLVITVLFVACAFAPFVSWAPALVWLLVAGLGLTVALRRA